MKPQDAFLDLKEFLNITDEQLQKGLYKPYEPLAKLWREANPQDDGEVIRWYMRKDVQTAYLYDLVAYWQVTSKREDLARFDAVIKKHELAKILDYGAGIGEAVLYLAKENPTAQFTYMDFKGVSTDFAKWRAKKHNIENVIFSEVVPIAPETYNGIVCLDTIEHLPNVEDITKMLCRALKNFGIFFVQAPFGHTETHPQHLAKNDFEASKLWDYFDECFMRRLEGQWDIWYRQL